MHGLVGVLGDLAGVGGIQQEVPGALKALALGLSIAVEDGSQLLPGDGGVGGEGGVGGAVDGADLRGPGHGIGVPGVGAHVREGGNLGCGGLSLQTPDHGDHHGPGSGAVGGEFVIAHAVHDVVPQGPVDAVVIPGVSLGVGELADGAVVVLGADVVLAGEGGNAFLGHGAQAVAAADFNAVPESLECQVLAQVRFLDGIGAGGGALNGGHVVDLAALLVGGDGVIVPLVGQALGVLRLDISDDLGTGDVVLLAVHADGAELGGMLLGLGLGGLALHPGVDDVCRGRRQFLKGDEAVLGLRSLGPVGVGALGGDGILLALHGFHLHISGAPHSQLRSLGLALRRPGGDKEPGGQGQEHDQGHAASSQVCQIHCLYSFRFYQQLSGPVRGGRDALSKQPRTPAGSPSKSPGSPGPSAP